MVTMMKVLVGQRNWGNLTLTAVQVGGIKSVTRQKRRRICNIKLNFILHKPIFRSEKRPICSIKLNLIILLHKPICIEKFSLEKTNESVT